jgi:FkbM family methyltransferase
MKNKLEALLLKFPKQYCRLLQLAGNNNHEKQFYLNHIKSNDFVFELGANRGYFTKIFSNITGVNGQVHAFEAVTPTYEKLRINCHNLNNSNLHLNNLAVGNENGIVKMNMPVGDDGQASLKKHEMGAWENAEIKQFSVEMIKLDDYVSQKRITRIDFVKCDIEGAELLALKGFSKTLRKLKPALFLEMYTPWMEAFNYTPNELIRFVQSLGYSRFYLSGETLVPLNIENLNCNEPENILCLA